MFALAKRASTFSDSSPYKVGCVVACKNKILSVGYNTSKTHPLQREFNIKRGVNPQYPSRLHAEINALSKINDMDLDWEKVSVYIYREHKNGVPACARPCNACMQMIKSLGIKNIFYTQDGSYCHEEITENTTGKFAKEKRSA